MSKDDKTFQQQILFEEVSAEDVNLEELNTEKLTTDKSFNASTRIKEPLYFESDDFSDDDKQEDYFKDVRLPKSKPRLLWKLFSITLLVLVLMEFVQFVIDGMQHSPISTSLYGVVFVSVFLMLGKILIKELSSLRQYKKQLTTQDKVNRVIQSDGTETLSAKVLCENITEQLPSDLAFSSDAVWENIDGLSESEIIQLYSRNVLSKVDEKALAEVTKYASETVVLISLSPIAILDMILMLWRNLIMLDKIAGLYGLKLTYWTRIALIKEAFKNMLYAGASELMVDFGADALGGEILGKLSTRMAQGLGAGMLTARLGLKAIYVCRPIPFEKAPKVSSLRKHVLQQVKALLLSSSPKDKSE